MPNDAITLTVDAENFRVERPNEVSLHFDRGKIQITDSRLLIVSDSTSRKALAIYNDGYWEAVIFNDREATSEAPDDH